MSENTCLINGYCYLVKKTFLFIEEYFEGIIPAGRLDTEITERTKEVYEQLAVCHEAGQKEKAAGLLEEYLTFATDYFEQGNPWETKENDRRACRNTILNSVQMIANLTYWLKAWSDQEKWLLCPASKVETCLSLDEKWQVHQVHSGYELPGDATAF